MVDIGIDLNVLLTLVLCTQGGKCGMNSVGTGSCKINTQTSNSRKRGNMLAKCATAG